MYLPQFPQNTNAKNVYKIQIGSFVENLVFLMHLYITAWQRKPIIRDNEKFQKGIARKTLEKTFPLHEQNS